MVCGYNRKSGEQKTAAQREKMVMTAKEKILVVDDEEDILELVRYNLTSEGYAVLLAETGEQAIDIARKEQPELIVLDLMLPGIDGMKVAALLRENDRTRSIPILMLTARSGESDEVLGLEAGADDYVTKPFSPKVLKARVRAILRRSERGENDDDIIDTGELRIDPGRRKVWVQGEETPLSFTEFQILLILIRRPGWVFSRSRIVDAVRGDNYPVTDRSVDVQIVGLRKKLGELGSHIETVRGVGYRFKEKS